MLSFLHFPSYSSFILLPFVENFQFQFEWNLSFISFHSIQITCKTCSVVSSSLSYFFSSFFLMLSFLFHPKICFRYYGLINFVITRITLSDTAIRRYFSMKNCCWDKDCNKIFQNWIYLGYNFIFNISCRNWKFKYAINFVEF